MDKKTLQSLARSYELIERRYLRRHTTDHSWRQLLGAIGEWWEYQFLPHYAGSPPLWRLTLRNLNRDRPLPDFAVVGPIKSGSSDLVTQLLLHPCVLPPLAKEIYSSEPENWRIFYPTVKERHRIELQHRMAITGFLAPFLHMYWMAERFSVACPNAKVIILLRDPVMRAYSHWKWDVLLGGKAVSQLEYYSTFERFVDATLECFPDDPMDSISGFPFLESGIYTRAVQMWLSRFGPQRTLVLNVADYFHDRTQVLGRVLDFLGLPPFVIQEADKPVNRNPLKTDPMSARTRAQLAEFYAPHNQRLYDLLGMSFDW